MHNLGNNAGRDFSYQWSHRTPFLVDATGLEGISDFRFVGGTPSKLVGVSERVRFVRFGDSVRVEWKDVPSEEKRDIRLVVIGALIALGAAMTLEAIRPAVESITSR